MKQILALIAISFCITPSFANTVRVSNGGDLIQVYNPRVVSLMLSAPYQLRLVIHSWLKEGNFFLPYNKLAAFEKLIVETPLIVQPQPCMVNGIAKTGAAYSGPNQYICLSWGRLEDIGDKDFPELQVIPLLAHEFLHLLDPEADDRATSNFQLHVTKYLMEYGIPAVNPSITAKIKLNFIADFDKIDWNDKSAVMKFVQGLDSFLKFQVDMLIRKQQGNYPILTEDKNILSDIEVRLLYLKMVTELNWSPNVHAQDMTDALSRLVGESDSRGSIKVSDIARIFSPELSFKITHVDANLPYLGKNPSRLDIKLLLLDLNRLINELNRSLDYMRLGRTPIKFTL